MNFIVVALVVLIVVIALSILWKNKKGYGYMFEMNDYEILKGWSKNNKSKINS